MTGRFAGFMRRASVEYLEELLLTGIPVATRRFLNMEQPTIEALRQLPWCQVTRQPGVYAWSFERALYVGQSFCFSTRKCQHLMPVRKGISGAAFDYARASGDSGSFKFIFKWEKSPLKLVLCLAETISILWLKTFQIPTPMESFYLGSPENGNMARRVLPDLRFPRLGINRALPIRQEVSN
jgi:hypothetical protein